MAGKTLEEVRAAGPAPDRAYHCGNFLVAVWEGRVWAEGPGGAPYPAPFAVVRFTAPPGELVPRADPGVGLYEDWGPAPPRDAGPALRPWRAC